MQVGEMQLEVELVAEQVLTEGAPEHRLNGVLGHGMYPQPVDIRVAVLTVGALVHLGAKRKQVLAGVERWPGGSMACPTSPSSHLANFSQDTLSLSCSACWRWAAWRPKGRSFLV